MLRSKYRWQSAVAVVADVVITDVVGVVVVVVLAVGVKDSVNDVVFFMSSS